MQPIEVAEKQQFERLQQSIMMNQTLKKFGQVQQDYAELMKKVQETINAGMAGKIPLEAAPEGGGTPAAACQQNHPGTPEPRIIDTYKQEARK